MSTDFDIIVAGGGIAGLTAALTAARLGRKTLVLTGNVLGGHLLNIEKIDGYPGFPEGVPGFDLCPIAQEQAIEAGAEFAMSEITGIEPAETGWQVATSDATYRCRAVILATGTRLREIGVPGESLLRGKGVSQCASCDAPLLSNRAAVVAGGGDSALQEALTLADHCSSVTVVHHGESLTAQASYRELAMQKPNIATLPNSEIVEITGADAVESVRVKSLTTGDTSVLDCAAVFVFVGLEFNSSYVADASLLDADGAIVTDTALRTALPALFAAGTVRAGSSARAAAAAGEGATAALSADRYLASGQWRAN